MKWWYRVKDEKKLRLLCLSGKTDEAAYVSDASGVHVVFFSKMEICRLCWRTVSIGFFFSAESLLLVAWPGRRFFFLLPPPTLEGLVGVEILGSLAAANLSETLCSCFGLFFVCVLNREKCQSVRIKDRSRFWLVGQCTPSGLIFFWENWIGRLTSAFVILVNYWKI